MAHYLSGLPENIITALDDIIINQEGGWKIWHTEGDDDGGWTLAGVTATTFIRYHGNTYADSNDNLLKISVITQLWKAVPDLVRQDIYAIYNIEYILPLRLDKLPSTITAPLLSCAINCGTKTAINLLQRAIAVTEDGIIGPATIAAASKSDNLLADFLAWWKYHYEVIANHDPSKEKFMAGWINRVDYYA